MIFCTIKLYCYREKKLPPYGCYQGVFIMYHNKKIGVFISHIMGFYQKNVCQGIIDKALEYGYTAEIFASMDGENLGDYSLGEESILTLPNFDDLSGVMFASETYPNEQLKDQIYSLLKEKCH